jgi:hypothetical protein
MREGDVVGGEGEVVEEGVCDGRVRLGIQGRDSALDTCASELPPTSVASSPRAGSALCCLRLSIILILSKDAMRRPKAVIFPLAAARFLRIRRKIPFLREAILSFM